MKICPALTLLNKECRNCTAIIDHFNNLNKNTHHKLTSLGICKGCPIYLEKNTIFSDPIIFSFNNSSIAISKKDAANIMISIKN